MSNATIITSIVLLAGLCMLVDQSLVSVLFTVIMAFMCLAMVFKYPKQS